MKYRDAWRVDLWTWGVGLALFFDLRPTPEQVLAEISERSDVRDVDGVLKDDILGEHYDVSKIKICILRYVKEPTFVTNPEE